MRLVCRRERGKVTKTLHCIKTRSTTSARAQNRDNNKSQQSKQRVQRRSEHWRRTTVDLQLFKLLFFLSKWALVHCKALSIYILVHFTAVYRGSHHEMLCFNCMFASGDKHSGWMEPSPQISLCHLPRRHHQKHDGFRAGRSE